MRTNLSGRVRNTSLPENHALLPLFEAVVNSIHSIEEIGNDFSSRYIIVSVIRSKQASLPLDKDTEKLNETEIVGFKVIDNGTGFNDHNFQSFKTLDSDYKRDKGCHGIGRLLWLKAFDNIKIRSIYETDRGLKGRTFLFDAAAGIKELDEFQDNCTKRETIVELTGLNQKYKNHIPKKLQSIAKALLEHCLWYFARTGGCPFITIEDDTEKILLNDLYEQCMHGAVLNEKIKIENYNFSIMHIKFRSLPLENQALCFCAGNRAITKEKLSEKIPGMQSKLQDDIGEFIYSCYVSSLFLDERVRSERIGFDIEENVEDKQEDLFKRKKISFPIIRQAIYESIQKYLAVELKQNIQNSKEIVEKFTHKVPRYRPLLNYLTDNDYMISPKINDKKLELHLHECLARVENEILEEGYNVLAVQQGENTDSYAARINKYVNAVCDLKKSDLANYLFHRKTIIELLKESLNSLYDGGKEYIKEDVIHQLIVPMKCDSNSVAMDNCNLWLIDEKLVFHDYLASDLSLKKMSITGSMEKERPDICSLELCNNSIYWNPLLVSDSKEGLESPTLASLTIVEIKRPMRDDAKAGTETDPILQVITYLEKIRAGKVLTPKGRPINLDGKVPGYCYVVCDLTPKIKECCKRWDLTESGDHMGYFGYHKSYESYIEVISFSKLIADTEKRHQRFFKALGLPLR
ncbi:MULTISPECIES: hypothetical protein [unclassified Bartonella]|uniref:hypothetical protein n=2 Tax=unclassified Bartonella TaxID=2645622 RepID=UPI0035D03DE2